MAELQRKKQKSVGTICKDAIMTGISYMIPVIVGGGVITAIAKMMGGYNIGDTAAEMQTLAQVIFTIGNNLFAFAVPCLAAFIAYAIADKPGIAPGYAMGVLAGLMKTGFVGGLVGALIAGWFVLQMKKIKVPKALQGIMPIMFIPVLSTLIVGLLMWYVIGVPIAGSNLDGMDALLSIVQMPSGIPVATVAINGSKNAAYLALQIMAIKHSEIKEGLLKERKQMEADAMKANDEVIEKYK